MFGGAVSGNSENEQALLKKYLEKYLAAIDSAMKKKGTVTAAQRAALSEG